MSVLLAVLASTTIVLASPFMGQLQSFLRRSLTTKNYVLLFGVGVLAAVGAAIFAGFMRIRERRLQRLSMLALALLAGGAYMWANRTPAPEVNAVERMHFVEYGLVGFLFYRAFKSAGDPSIILMPLLAGFIVGTLDELVQWFIPVRVGEAHDVFINLVSTACGLLFALALDPPPDFSARWHAGSIRAVATVALVAWIVFAVFVGEVHLGYAIDEPGIGLFRSHYTTDQLNALQGDRTARWRSDPPRTLHRLSREDQYLDEGLWHVRRRNVTDPAESWRENLILEKYFAPVLDTPTYASPQGNRWPPAQRADLEARSASTAMNFASAAEPYPIVTWPKAVYWTVVILGALMLATGAIVAG
jgi:VanZ family protein